MDTNRAGVDEARGPSEGVAGRVLLVEDDELIRDALQILLSERLEVDAVGSAEEALERFVAGRYDALVTDLGLPGRKGHELLVALREVDPGLAAVLITADEMDDGDERLAGFERWWQKPMLDLDHVLDGVVAAAQGSRLRRAG